MKFEPHRFDEKQNPNIPHEHPGREVLRMGAWLLGLLLAAWLLVTALVQALPHLLSLERERAWFGSVVAEALSDNSRPDARLQTLADALGRRMGLPAGSVQVRLSGDDIPNAFATFGGQVVLMRGLLERLPTEEAVAGVLAHEIAHIRHRDPLRGVSRALLLGLLWGAITSHHGSIETITSLETLRHSRAQEEAADAAAVDALAAHYRSAGGMVQLMQTLGRIEAGEMTAGSGPVTGNDAGNGDGIGDRNDAGDDTGNGDGRAAGSGGTPRRASWRWLSSHPHTADRLKAIEQRARERGFSLTPPSRPNPWREIPSSAP